MSWPSDVEYIARSWEDWAVCTWADGAAVAYNKNTGRWCRLPHPDCPVVVCNFDVIAPRPKAETRYTITAKGLEILEGK